jgi:hypothetical protein
MKSVFATPLLGLLLLSPFASAEDIVHDAEFYVLKAQHGDKWAKEDEGLNKKLAELKAKHGRPPNIIHIMWDDTGVGELGLEVSNIYRRIAVSQRRILTSSPLRVSITRACTPNLPVRHLAQPS